MSGNPTGSNVVPMPHAATPAPAQPPMPMPQMWGGGGSLPWGPGCCPPGGMDALLKCYCDVQAATAFICSVMVQCIQTNPAVTAAIIAAIEASGSSLPLIGVTNGTAAQPGQVGENVTFFQYAPMPVGNTTNAIVSLGTLPPGNWLAFAFATFTQPVTYAEFTLTPSAAPPGFAFDMNGAISVPGGVDVVNMQADPVSALTSVPTLIAFSYSTQGVVTAGQIGITFNAVRVR